jgi:hypothetical protein
MEFQLLKKIAHIFTLTLPLAFVACGNPNPTEPTPAPTEARVAPKSCEGSYVGMIDKPSLEVRLAIYQEWLRRNPNLIGPAVYDPNDPSIQGMYLAGSFAFETDANCNVVKGGVNIFDEYPFTVEGTVNADRSFDVVWTESNFRSQIVGQINQDDSISGQVKLAVPQDYIYGLMNGKFTPNGKI